MKAAAPATIHGADPAGRWPARLELKFAARQGRTELVERRRLGPLSVQRPFFPEGDICHVYLLHPPGGVAGGDDLDLRVSLAPSARSLATTPGATKFYRTSGPNATLRQVLEVGDGATLEWLPQENIFFPGADAALATEIRLRGGARVAAWEVQCLGRPVINERFDYGSLDARFALFRDGRPILRERLRVQGVEVLDSASGLRGFPVSATLLMTGANAAFLASAREVADAAAIDGLVHGITLIEDVLVARVLARATEPVRHLYTALWLAWRHDVTGYDACPPRIWAT
jgi:urease accessory protein